MSDNDIKLPPLPKASKMYDIPGYDEEELKDYARAAVLADRASRDPSPQGDARLDLTLLSAWEKCAYDHELDFFEEFGPTSAWELVKVSFHAGGVEYTALLECGVQCINSVPMEDWLKFYAANAELPRSGTYT